MNKPTSRPKRLRRCIHLVFSDASSKSQATSQGQISTEKNIHSYRVSCWQILVSSARWSEVLSFLSYLAWRVWHVSESPPDMITYKPICLKLACLIHRSELSVNPCQ
ncbi:hypothetical protein TNCV_3397471 [Trichonephila clavipes]|nr:hypothetical protein TNCV_3397471 [Trichonephila clavipes]